MHYSHYNPYGITPILQNNGLIYNNNHMPYDWGYYDVNQEDQRFFPVLLPFVAGLALGPLLFNRPCCPPYAPYAPYPAYPPYPVAPQGYPVPPYPMTAFNQQQAFNQSQQAINPVYGGITENVNIFTK